MFAGLKVEEPVTDATPCTKAVPVACPTITFVAATPSILNVPTSRSLIRVAKAVGIADKNRAMSVHAKNEKIIFIVIPFVFMFLHKGHDSPYPV